MPENTTFCYKSSLSSSSLSCSIAKRTWPFWMKRWENKAIAKMHLHACVLGVKISCKYRCCTCSIVMKTYYIIYDSFNILVLSKIFRQNMVKYEIFYHSSNYLRFRDHPQANMVLKMKGIPLYSIINNFCSKSQWLVGWKQNDALDSFSLFLTCPRYHASQENPRVVYTCSKVLLYLSFWLLLQSCWCMCKGYSG